MGQLLPFPDRFPSAPKRRVTTCGFIQTYPGAVAYVLPEVELWLSPAAARSLAADLLACATDAERTVRP